MSFNKRFLSESTLLKSAKEKTFIEFQSYLVKTDAFIYEDEFSSGFCNWFMIEKIDSDSRKSLYELLKNKR
jgi:hypothetical protein